MIELFIKQEWVKPAKEFDAINISLIAFNFLLTVLEYMENRRSFCRFEIETGLSKEEHGCFIAVFKNAERLQG